MDYNRIVKDLNGLSTEEYMLKVSEKFDISIYEGEGHISLLVSIPTECI